MPDVASPGLPDPAVHPRSAARRRLAPAHRAALVTACVALEAVLPAAAAPAAMGGEVELERTSIAELKRVYLACDRAAAGGRLSSAGVMHCSVVYETLKRRAFGGDFDRIRAWSRVQPTPTGNTP